MPLFVQQQSKDSWKQLQQAHGTYRPDPNSQIGRIVKTLKETRVGNQIPVPMNSLGRIIERNDTQLRLVVHGEDESVDFGQDNSRRTYVVPIADVLFGIAADEHTPTRAIGDPKSKPPAPARFCQITADYGKVAKNTPGIVRSIDKNYFGVTVDIPGDGNNRLSVWLPSNIVTVMAPPDAAMNMGRVVRILRGFSDQGTPYRANEMGRVTKLSDNWGVWINVQMFRTNAIIKVAAVFCHFGRFYGQWLITTPSTSPLPITNAPDPDLNDVPAGFDTSTDLRCIAFQLLRAISDTASRMSKLNLSQEHVSLFDTTEKAKRFASMIRNGTLPSVLNVLERKSFTFDQVFAAGKVIRKDKPNNTPGYYQRRYSNFKKGTDYFGHKPKHYGGITKDQNARLDSHRQAAERPSDRQYHTTHSKIKRAARLTEVMQLFELPEDWRDASNEILQQRRLEIVENVYFLILKMYSPKVINAEAIVSAHGDASIEEYIQSSFVMRETATNLTRIAEQSLAAIGWGAAKKSLFNEGEEALNISSPLGAYHVLRYERILWSRTSIVDEHQGGKIELMTVFRRSQTRLRLKDRGASGVFLALKDMGANKADFHTDVQLLEKYGPPKDTMGWLQVEIMPSGVHHDTPYVQAPLATPWSNLDQVLGVGIQFIWIENGVPVARYLTCPKHQYPHPSNTEATPASFPSFNMTAALRAYLMHEPIVNRPPGVPDFGLARIMETKIDQLEQKIQANYVTARATSQRMQLDRNRSVTAMQRAGLQRIGGTFRNIDTQGIRARTARGEVSTQNRNILLGRMRCDRCWIVNRYDMEHEAGSSRCEQDGNSNVCKECKSRNYQCSWTPTDQLMGHIALDAGGVDVVPAGQKHYEMQLSDGNLASARNALVKLWSQALEEGVKKVIVHPGAIPLEIVPENGDEPSSDVE